jgi:hypothetical protein
VQQGAAVAWSSALLASRLGRVTGGSAGSLGARQSTASVAVTSWCLAVTAAALVAVCAWRIGTRWNWWWAVLVAVEAVGVVGLLSGRGPASWDTMLSPACLVCVAWCAVLWGHTPQPRAALGRRGRLLVAGGVPMAAIAGPAEGHRRRSGRKRQRRRR